MKIAIDAGHGGSASGAVFAGRKEKDLNQELATAIMNDVRPHHNIIITREKDTTVPNEERVFIANSFGVDLFLSIHHNAGRGNGFEALYFPRSIKGKKIATAIADKVTSRWDIRNRGAKPGWYRGRVGTHIKVLRETHMPAVLIEACFMDGHKDIVLLDDTVRPVFYESIANSIKEVLDEISTTA